MNINAKQLEAAATMLQEIKKLDAEITQLEKYAAKTANDAVDLELQFDVIDLKKPKVTTVGDMFDEDGNLRHDRLHRHIHIDFAGFFGRHAYEPVLKHTDPVKNNEITFYKQRVSNSAGLRIIGILVFEKKDRREYLISQLHKMGFQL